MTKLLEQLLTSMVGVIAEYHKGTIRTEKEFLEQLSPAILAVQDEIKRNKEKIISVK